MKTGNQSGSRFYPYGKSKKKPRGKSRGAYQQGGYQVPVPASQYLVPQPFYPQSQCGGFCGDHWGSGGRRGRGKNPTNQPQKQQPSNDNLTSLPQRSLGHDFWVPKCDHGWPFQKEPDPTHRMVPVSPNIQTDCKTLGTSSGGPIRNKTECQISTICLPDPRRTGMGHGSF